MVWALQLWCVVARNLLSQHALQVEHLPKKLRSAPNQKDHLQIQRLAQSYVIPGEIWRYTDTDSQDFVLLCMICHVVRLLMLPCRKVEC